MRGRQGGHHRHFGQDATERQHGLDAFACRQNVVRYIEANGVAEEMAHRAFGRIDGRLSLSAGIEPGAVRPGQMPREIGDGSDHRRPGLGRAVFVRPIVAARVEAEASGSVQNRNAAIAKIRFYESTRNRLRHGEQSPCCLRRSGWNAGRSRSGTIRLRLSVRQAEERTCLISNVLEVDQAAAFPDHVEQIAMLAGRGVGPFPGRPFWRLLEPNEHRAARRVAHIAHQSIAALPPSGGEVAAAHRLGVTRETVSQFGGVVACHHAALPSSCCASSA